jgi:drug/metabolite transporter (DMT)-like permease
MNQLIVMGAMAGAAFLGAIGQIMLRLASDKFRLSVSGLLANWPLYIFVATYGVAVLINIWAYKAGGKVAVIYPVIALSYIFAALIAWKFLGEPMTAWTWAGSIVIVAGVGMIGYGVTV